MNDDRDEEAQPAEQASGRSGRAEQHLAHPVPAFDLEEEAQQLHREESWLKGTRSARTLVKEPDFRVVLIALKRGARIEAHRAPGRISIQALSGRLRVRAGDQIVELPAHHMVSLEPNIMHDVEAGADGDSTFLLTIAWPAQGSGA